MLFGIFAGNNNVEKLSAHLAVNHHCDREVPFHKRLVLRLMKSKQVTGTVKG
jgi:hypothetical protein